jgi:predicted TIM-barrel fold metal-dependent hydrolase
MRVRQRGRARTAAPASLPRRMFLTGVAAAGLEGALASCASTQKHPTWPKASACDPAHCTMVDVHCHIFNGADLPISGFLSHHLAPAPADWTRPVADLVRGPINELAPGGAEELATLASAFGDAAPVVPSAASRARQEALSQSVRRLVAAAPARLRSLGSPDGFAHALGLTLLGRAELAATLAQAYPAANLFTPCLVDFDAWSQDAAKTPLAVQMQVQERIAKLSIVDRIGRAGARIHPLVAFDPLREARGTIMKADTYHPFKASEPFKIGTKWSDADALGAVDGAAWAKRLAAPPPNASALALVRYAVERGGFVGVKMYPPVGFKPLGNEQWSFHQSSGLGAPLDLALRALYTYCEALEVPITVHASPANGYDLGYGDLAAPSRWAPVLEEFPKLRLNIGHFGHLAGVDQERGIRACEAWMRQASVLIQNHDNVFADMSNSQLPADDDYAKRFLDALTKTFDKFCRVKTRLMYGSDWWMNTIDENDAQFLDGFVARLSGAFDESTRQTLMGTNALRYLGLLDDSGKKPIASLNRKRLQTFYESQTQPAWLKDG